MGGMTVSELVDRMSLEEYQNWQAFCVKEPLPSERVDLSGAIVASTLANVNRSRGTKAYEVADFMLIQKGLVDKDEEAKLNEDQHMILTLMALGKMN